MASGGIATDGSTGEGEEQDEPSSSSLDNLAVDCIRLQENNEEEALLAFRQQWQKELVSSPQRGVAKTNLHQADVDSDNLEEKAKQLFLKGVELERCGKLYEAVQQYKKAVQLMPDVESKLYQSSEMRSDTPDKQGILETQAEETVLDEESEVADEDTSCDGDLYNKLEKILAKNERLCEPALPQREVHISWLPFELVLLIIKWVVSSELDATSLENMASVCRGFYVATRDQEIWRILCARTWGLNCGNPKSSGYNSWRSMYIERPRLHLHGCYISKTTYLRHGENSFQDQFYRPWYLIAFYRYLRFFPEGLVLMWTTTEEPASSVALLKSRMYKHHLGIMSGHYRLIGDKVVIVVKKNLNEKRPAQVANTRFRARRKDAQEQPDQTFKLELKVKSVRKRRNWQLSWCKYSITYRRGAIDYSTNFDLTSNKFPPFAFSCVRHYTAETEAPLA